MRVLVVAAALLVSAVAIATQQWVYLAYVVGVLGTLFFWQPSWRRAKWPAPPTLTETEAAEAIQGLKRWRATLMPASLISVLFMGHAFSRLVVAGDSMFATGLATVLASSLTLWLVSIQRQIEAIEHR